MGSYHAVPKFSLSDYYLLRTVMRCNRLEKKWKQKEHLILLGQIDLAMIIIACFSTFNLQGTMSNIYLQLNSELFSHLLAMNGHHLYIFPPFQNEVNSPNVLMAQPFEKLSILREVK